MKTFGEVREKNLELWIKTLQMEKQADFYYDFDENDWCKLQEEFAKRKLHSNFICSFLDWLDNLTDLLTDERFDSKEFDRYEDSHILFRYYTRVLLVSSEILEDYTELYKGVIAKSEKKEAREGLNKDLHWLMGFINKVCKHKSGKDNLHSCNNHLEILFKDSDDSPDLDYPSKANPRIIVPSLEFIIQMILNINSSLLTIIGSDKELKEQFFNYHSENEELTEAVVSPA
ncbi:hypothetical protein BH20ACI1_BH20ACI1_26590 [soil metagenome]